MLSFVTYFETLLQLSLHLCQLIHVNTLKFWEEISFYHFSKKRLFSVFLHTESQLSLKNA